MDIFLQTELYKAEASIQISLQANGPTKSASQRILALINCAKGEVDKAETLLAKALKEDPESAENNLIQIAILTKKNEAFLMALIDQKGLVTIDIRKTLLPSLIYRSIPDWSNIFMELSQQI